MLALPSARPAASRAWLIRERTIIARAMSRPAPAANPIGTSDSPKMIATFPLFDPTSPRNRAINPAHIGNSPANSPTILRRVPQRICYDFEVPFPNAYRRTDPVMVHVPSRHASLPLVHHAGGFQ